MLTNFRTYLLYLLLWGLPLSTLQAQTVAIPDTTFEHILINLGHDTDGQLNGQISQTDALKVLDLNLDATAVEDLTGIQAFTHLRTLTCRHSAIRRLNLSGLPLLHYVNGEQSTQLAKVNGSNLPELAILNLDGTAVDTIDLQNSPKLYQLFLEDTPLRQLKVIGAAPSLEIVANNSSLAQLQTGEVDPVRSLRLDGCQLQNWSFASATLERLDLDRNQLTHIDLRGAPALKRVDCSNNPLIRLEMGSHPSLHTLICNQGNLDRLDLSGCTGLVHLSVVNHDLTHLELPNAITLETISAGYNELTTLTIGERPRLMDLRLEGNQIQTFDASIFPALRFLNLSQNRLRFLKTHGARLSTYKRTPGFPPSVHCQLRANTDTLVVCADFASRRWTYTFDQTLVFTGECSQNNFIGVVKEDLNLNCLSDASEPYFSHTWLQIIGQGDTILTRANSDGWYREPLAVGQYQLELSSSLPYRAVCNPFHTLTVDSLDDRDTLDLGAVQETDFCHYLEVSLSAPFLRATGGGSYYMVRYCNLGTAAASNAYVEVDLDPALIVLNSSIPIQSQNGTVYTFDLGTVLPGACNAFTIGVIADSTTSPNEILCSEAHIYPDTLCSHPWGGPIISASNECDTDTVTFHLQNQGGNMTQPYRYTIFEDQIMMRTGTYQLGPGGSVRLPHPVQAGKIYRIEAIQPNGVPLYLANPVAHSTALGCLPDFSGTGNGNFAAQFYQGNTTPWIARDCQPMRAAYDPNDKTPQPLGYGPSHYIERDIPIHYRVRFQNTGNDTAFHVFILDTLSPHVEVSSLEFHTASHDYQWRIVGGRVLRVDFPNIKLVDSTTNEPLSHGYFTYTIQQKPNLPLETRIENQAAIYFDYNPPIFTNTTWHTIGKNFWPLHPMPDINQADFNIPVKVWPNPFQTTTTFELETILPEQLRLEVRDLLGRLVATTSAEATNVLVFERGKLPAGVYTYELYAGGQRLNTGKLVVQ